MQLFAYKRRRRPVNVLEWLWPNVLDVWWEEQDEEPDSCELFCVEVAGYPAPFQFECNDGSELETAFRPLMSAKGGSAVRRKSSGLGGANAKVRFGTPQIFSIAPRCPSVGASESECGSEPNSPSPMAPGAQDPAAVAALAAAAVAAAAAAAGEPAASAALAVADAVASVSVGDRVAKSAGDLKDMLPDATETEELPCEGSCVMVAGGTTTSSGA